MQAAYAAIVASQVRLIATLNTEIAELGQVVADHFGRHRDAERYLSLPGLGVVLGARILGEFGDDPHRYTDAKARKNYAGTSPITRASGSRSVVLARYARNRRLGDAVHQWAFCALTRLTRRPRLLPTAPRPRHRPPSRPAPTRQPPRRHPPRLPQDQHPLQRDHRLGPPLNPPLDTQKHGMSEGSPVRSPGSAVRSRAGGRPPRLRVSETATEVQGRPPSWAHDTLTEDWPDPCSPTPTCTSALKRSSVERPRSRSSGSCSSTVTADADTGGDAPEDSPLRPDRRLVHRVGAADEESPEALVGAATGAGLGCLGVFTSTTAGVRRLR